MFIFCATFSFFILGIKEREMGTQGWGRGRARGRGNGWEREGGRLVGEGDNWGEERENL